MAPPLDSRDFDFASGPTGVEPAASVHQASASALHCEYAMCLCVHSSVWVQLMWW